MSGNDLERQHFRVDVADAVLTSDESGISDDEFWRRDIHQHLRQFARSRLVSPWATVGAALGHCAAHIPPHVVLPPYVGGPGSANLIVALVGPAAAGKDAAEAVARDALNFENASTVPEVVPLGSGEGIAATFRPPGTEPGDPNPVNAAIFSAPEIDTWAALAVRHGSTVTAEIRKLYSGQAIGHANAGKTTRRIVGAHTYRACVTLGVQPLRSAPLFAASDGGLPQRIVWLPANDPGAPDTPPLSPRKRTVEMPTWPEPPADGGLVEVEVMTTQAGEMIVAHRRSVLRSETANLLDGHALFTRLKVALALACLDQRNYITDDDWRLAGVVVAVSDRTRRQCEEALVEERRRTTHGRALARVEGEEFVAERKHQRCKQGILRWVKKFGPSSHISRRDLRQKLKEDIRPCFEAAIAELIEDGCVVELALDRGVGYTAGTPVHPWTPQPNWGDGTENDGVPRDTVWPARDHDYAEHKAAATCSDAATNPQCDSSTATQDVFSDPITVTDVENCEEEDR